MTQPAWFSWSKTELSKWITKKTPSTLFTNLRIHCWDSQSSSRWITNKTSWLFLHKKTVFTKILKRKLKLIWTRGLTSELLRRSFMTRKTLVSIWLQTNLTRNWDSSSLEWVRQTQPMTSSSWLSTKISLILVIANWMSWDLKPISLRNWWLVTRLSISTLTTL